MGQNIIIASIVLLSLTVMGCRHRSTPQAQELGDTITTESRLLTLIDCSDYVIAEVANPWKEGELLGRYILCQRNGERPARLPEGTIVEVPLESSLVYSSVHAGIIDELGAVKLITGVCDARYFKIKPIRDGLAAGTVVDAGVSTSPSMEKIIELSPSAILASSFQNSGHEVLAKAGMTVIECADYMEATPLGRAEWIKFFGLLYGKQTEANRIYDTVKTEYARLVAATDTIKTRRPKVISETLTDGIWYVPGGRSYQARLFADAGASYPWSDDRSVGSLPLDFATVLDKAHDADIWLVKTYGHDLTLDELKKSYPLNARFAAFNKGGVYACNTAESTLYEDFPFHPERLLREYVDIFYPGLLGDSTLSYYKQVK